MTDQNEGTLQLSPLLANVALTDLDRALDRGADFITYVRYLDDMVVLAPDSERGRRWADRALERIRSEAAASARVGDRPRLRHYSAVPPIERPRVPPCESR